MMARRETEGFHCLDFKDQVQEEIRRQTKGMTRAELKQYFQERVESGPFANLWKQIPSRSSEPRRLASRRTS